MIIAVVATVVAACGTSHAPAGGQPQGAASPAARTALTVAANNSTIRVPVGRRVWVALARRGAFSWHVPGVTGTSLRRTSASGGYPGHLAARATFLAVSPGRAILTSISDAACLHAQPACMIAQQGWRVVVIVTDRPA